MAEAAASDPQTQLNAYKDAVGIYTKETFPATSITDDLCVDKLTQALCQIGFQMPIVRNMFIEHCAELVLTDAHVTHKENSLLLFLAYSLDVPMPRLLPSSVRL